MSVSPPVYLETTRAHLTKYSVHVTRGRGYRSFSVDTEIRYVIPVLWMTACFHSGPKGSVALWLQATSLHRRADLFTVSFMAFQLKHQYSGTLQTSPWHPIV